MILNHAKKRMQIANSLVSTRGTSHNFYNYVTLTSSSKRRGLNVSFWSQNVDRLTFFTPFLSYLYNVKKLDSKRVDENSRISVCFSRNSFKNGLKYRLLLSWKYYTCSLHDNLKLRQCRNRSVIMGMIGSGKKLLGFEIFFFLNDGGYVFSSHKVIGL